MSGTILDFLRRFPPIRNLWEELESVKAHRDQAVAERDAARVAEQAMRAERYAALEQRDAARAAEQARRAEHAEATAARDAARLAERMIRSEGEALAEEIDALHLNAAPSDALGEIKDRFHLAAEPRAGAGKRAVIVPVHGPIAGREIRVTQPFFENYCRNIGADLHIVDVLGSTHELRVKASLLPVAREYRRFAFIDPDVLIREGCPDLFSIVSDDRLGAVAEGQWTGRSEICAELARMYGHDVPLPTSRYVDTGVMVMSAAHRSLLETFAQPPLVAHPRGEQGLINALLYRDDVPVQHLPREFNWIPYTAEDFDWRWGWIFHMADNWRSQPRSTDAWRMRGQGSHRIAAPASLSSLHCRLPCLMEVAEQIRGNNVRVFHPADMGFHPPAARLLLTPDDAAVMWCESTVPGGWQPPPIYGPYASLESGRWSISLLASDQRTAADDAVIVDVVCDGGNTVIRRPAPVGPGAMFEIFFDSDLKDVEVRLYRSDREFAVGSIVFRRISD